jgi:hypothetical protein
MVTTYLLMVEIGNENDSFVKKKIGFASMTVYIRDERRVERNCKQHLSRSALRSLTTLAPKP